MQTIEKKSVKAGKYVNNEHVNTLMRNYKQERWVNNSKHIGKEDSLSSWYSVEELEEFIEMIKMNGGDGIRFYFGAYSADFAPKPEYASRQTIVMVATKTRGVENGVVKTKDLYINEDGEPQILAYNVGQLCPPLCGGGTPPKPKRPAELGRTLVDMGDGLSVV